MQMRKIQHEALLREWQEIITACRNSGISASAWCRQNNVKESRYYYWLKALRSKALALRVSGSQQPVFAEVAAPALPSGQPTSEPGLCAVIRINEAAVEIYNGASQATISAIIQTLQSC